MIENAVYDERGMVAVRYYQPIPKLIKVAGRDYVTDVRYGVAMVLADEKDVPALLAHEGGCCGGKRKVFFLANQESYNVWKTGSR